MEKTKIRRISNATLLKNYKINFLLLNICIVLLSFFGSINIGVSETWKAKNFNFSIEYDKNNWDRVRHKDENKEKFQYAFIDLSHKRTLEYFEIALQVSPIPKYDKIDLLKHLKQRAYNKNWYIQRYYTQKYFNYDMQCSQHVELDQEINLCIFAYYKNKKRIDITLGFTIQCNTDRSKQLASSSAMLKILDSTQFKILGYIKKKNTPATSNNTLGKNACDLKRSIGYRPDVSYKMVSDNPMYSKYKPGYQCVAKGMPAGLYRQRKNKKVKYAYIANHFETVAEFDYRSIRRVTMQFNTKHCNNCVLVTALNENNQTLQYLLNLKNGKNRNQLIPLASNKYFVLKKGLSNSFTTKGKGVRLLGRVKRKKKHTYLPGRCGNEKNAVSNNGIPMTVMLLDYTDFTLFNSKKLQSINMKIRRFKTYTGKHIRYHYSIRNQNNRIYRYTNASQFPKTNTSEQFGTYYHHIVKTYNQVFNSEYKKGVFPLVKSISTYTSDGKPDWWGVYRYPQYPGDTKDFEFKRVYVFKDLKKLLKKLDAIDKSFVNSNSRKYRLTDVPEKERLVRIEYYSNHGKLLNVKTMTAYGYYVEVLTDDYSAGAGTIYGGAH